ncbi:MAG: FmdB family zinc ribbon protein [Planctomycetota bacterium]|jgi:putative FmdB family regulatory protein
MPIYEFVCRECGHPFEALVRGDEKPSCPSCGRKRLAKQLSVPAAHVAGANESMCPGKAQGACSMPGCGGGQCDLAQWQ